MANKKMHHAVIGADTFELIDEGARTEIASLKEDLDNLTDIEVTWTKGYRLAGNGVEVSTNDWYITNYIELRDDVIFQLAFTLQTSNTVIAYSIYNAQKEWISNHAAGSSSYGYVNGVTEISNRNAKYIRFCSFDSNGKHSVKISNINGFLLKDGFITNQFLAKNTVTLDKCEFSVHDPESNYVDTSKIISGYYVQDNGTLKVESGYAATDYCEVKPGTELYAYHLVSGYCAFYDSTKTLIVGYSYGEVSFPLTVPNGAVYARFSSNTGWWPDTTEIWLFTKNEKPKPYTIGIDAPILSESENVNPCDYNGDEISVFNKCLCIGDSMTIGTFNYVESGITHYAVYEKYSYPTYLRKLTGIDTTNLGRGGETSVQWWNNEQSSDLSGYDIAIIQLGINDEIAYTTLGSETKTALSNIINKLKSENNNIKIFVANIIPATSYSSPTMITFSDDLLEWLTTTYASDPNVIPLDIQQYGHTGDSPAYNCGHLSALGYRRLAQDYKNYISWYINNNGNVFQQVQFIGTNHVYE